jgi:hypothetical protein
MQGTGGPKGGLCGTARTTCLDQSKQAQHGRENADGAMSDGLQIENDADQSSEWLSHESLRPTALDGNRPIATVVVIDCRLQTVSSQRVCPSAEPNHG